MTFNYDKSMATEANVVARLRKQATMTPGNATILLFSSCSRHGLPCEELHIRTHTRMGVSHWKNAVSPTANWFLNKVPGICNLISFLCNEVKIEGQVT